MHGLVNRSIEYFARQTHGDAVWTAAATAAGVDPRGVELMCEQDDSTARRLLHEIAALVGCSPPELAGDIGAWVAQRSAIRRLLRFAGRDFASFVTTLDQLRGRARLVLRDLELPAISVAPLPRGWKLTPACDEVWLHALAGVLHAMADDYGVLAVIEIRGDSILVDVPVVDFNEGRPFSISDPSVGAA